MFVISIYNNICYNTVYIMWLQMGTHSTLVQRTIMILQLYGIKSLNNRDKGNIKVKQ